MLQQYSKLKHLIDSLPEEEQKKIVQEFAVSFPELKTGDTPFSLNDLPEYIEQERRDVEILCGRVRFAKEQDDEFLCEKIAKILHASLKLPLEDMTAMAKNVIVFGSRDVVYYYLCKQIGLKMRNDYLIDKEYDSSEVYNTEVGAQALYLCACGAEDPICKSELLRDVCFCYKKLNLLEVALTIAREISDDEQKSYILDFISIAYSDKGDLETALAIAREIPSYRNCWGKSWALSSISQAYSDKGDLETALAIAREIPDATYKSESLRKISLVYAQQRAFIKANTIAEEIYDPDMRSKTLEEIHSIVTHRGRRN